MRPGPPADQEPPALRVVAAAVVQDRRLLLVSKAAAPDVLYLPGGKPSDGETAARTLEREIAEELSVGVTHLRELAEVRAPAALEGVPMEMSVFLATLTGAPRPAAEIARMVWWSTDEPPQGRLAPAVAGHVIPLLRALGAI